MNKYTTEYKDFLIKLEKDINGSKYLELKVKTIKSDIENFEEMIPCLDDLLKFCMNDNESLLEIRNRIKKGLENSDESNIYENIPNKMQSSSLSWGGEISEIDKNSRKMHMKFVI